MIVLGLTGSIATGKSTTSRLFRAAGVPVHDADASVHALYAGRAVFPIEAAFPGVVREARVDRALLKARLAEDPSGFARLEAIVHPMVREEEEQFLVHARASGARVAVLDIPLLFETGGAVRCRAVAVTTVDPATQRARVLARPGMSEESLNLILSRQMPDAEKRRRAHFLIDSGHGLEAARRRVEAILRAIHMMI